MMRDHCGVFQSVYSVSADTFLYPQFVIPLMTGGTCIHKAEAEAGTPRGTER